MSDSQLTGDSVTKGLIAVRTDRRKVDERRTKLEVNVQHERTMAASEGRALEPHFDEIADLLSQAEDLAVKCEKVILEARPILRKEVDSEGKEKITEDDLKKVVKLGEHAADILRQSVAKLDSARDLFTSHSSAQPEKQEPEAPKASAPAKTPEPAEPNPAPQTKAQPVQEPASEPEQSSASTNTKEMTSQDIIDLVKAEVKKEMSVVHETLYHQLYDEFLKAGFLPAVWVEYFQTHTPEDIHQAAKTNTLWQRLVDFAKSKQVHAVYGFGGKHTNKAQPQQETNIPEAAPEERASTK